MTFDLTSGIVRILRPDGTTSGTGFLVSKDGLIATCSHVVQPEISQDLGDPRPEEVSVVFQATGDEGLARVDEWRPYDAEDVAILRLEGDLPEGVRDLPLGTSAGTSAHRFQTFGFPDAGPEGGMWGDGHIQGKTQIKGVEVLQISSQQVTPGFSGAPVLDTATRRVVGMVNGIIPPDKYGRLGTTAFATATETLREVCPHLTFSDRAPYLGLDPFTETNADIFFGRRKVVAQLAERLQQNPRFLAVLGPSGSGKSSVIGAGLIPQLRRGCVPGSDRWGIITAQANDKPFENLEAKGLEGARNGLAEAARKWLAKNLDKTRLMLILDQFEQLLATAPPEEQHYFFSQLRGLLDSDLPITLVLIMRDDFFSRFAQVAPKTLFECVQRGFIHISPELDEEELKDIIESPASKIGLQFEEGLVAAIIRDVLEITSKGMKAGRSTILPLLEFALTELWKRRKEGYLTHGGYIAIGGVTGSLTQWADQTYQSLAGEGLGNVTCNVLTELVEPGDERKGIPDTKRRRTLGDLGTDPAKLESIRNVIVKLANARLVTTSFDHQNNQDTFEIIHDSLIQEWSRLRQWLDEDRSFLARKSDLQKKALDWKHTATDNIARRDEGSLLRGLSLSEAEKWLKERDLGQVETEYILASLDMRDTEERRKLRNIRILATITIAALVLVVISAYQWDQAEKSRQESMVLYLSGQSELLQAGQADSFFQGVLLAIESIKRQPTPAGDTALRHGLALLPRKIFSMAHRGGVLDIAFSPDGKKIATASSDRSAMVWDADTGNNLASMNHSDLVWNLAFSPDGMKIATASSDNTARVWDVRTGKELAKVNHDDLVMYVAFSPDGSQIATASWDCTAKIWDVITGTELAKFSHDKEVIAVAFSPDGTKIASAGGDNKVRLWDIATPSKELANLSHDNRLNAVVFSPDGTQIATASDDSSAKIWNASDGKELARMNHIDSVWKAVFSPDSMKIATASSDKTARLWDVKTGDELARVNHDDEVTDVVFSPDGTKIATASSDRTARLWDSVTGKQLAIMSHDSAVTALAFSPDGTKIATSSDDGLIKVWDATTGMEKVKVDHDDAVWSIAFSPDGTKIATASGDEYARVWDIATAKEIFRMDHSSEVRDIDFSHDGAKIVTASMDGTAKIWDIANDKELCELRHDKDVVALAFSYDGARIATASLDGTAKIWNVATGEELLKVGHDMEVVAVGFSPDGTKIATASFDNTARVWDAITGKELAELNHDREVVALAFSYDGARIATASLDGTAKIWDVAADNEPLTLRHDEEVIAVEFSPDGTKIATASLDDTASVWEANTGKELATLVHDDDVVAVAFSPDGTQIATAGFDYTARIWSVATATETIRINHDDFLIDVVFSPDGTQIATTSFDCTARIWQLRPQDLIDEACHRLERNLALEEWVRYFPDEAYCKTCPNLP